MCGLYDQCIKIGFTFWAILVEATLDFGGLLFTNNYSIRETVSSMGALPVTIVRRSFTKLLSSLKTDSQLAPE